MISVKALAESPALTTIPPSYAHKPNPNDVVVSLLQDSIPTVDLSLLSSDSPDQRSVAVQDLGRACREWGFFTVINHGVPESLINAMLDACTQFFNLTEQEKQEYQGKHVLDPIRCGTSFNFSAENVFFWRDYLKLIVHPQFHSPSKPEGFSEVASEYCKKTRAVALQLLRGISESLGLEGGYIERALNLDSGFQILAANLYPPCPQPDLGMGLGPHSDHGLLTLLVQNGICGLQVQHEGKWVPVNGKPNSFLVNTGDHMEILSNGQYKSVVHRAVVNNKITRVSIAAVHGPSLETTVRPSAELVDAKEGEAAAAYAPMEYREYLELQQSNPIYGKSALDRVRVQPPI